MLPGICAGSVTGFFGTGGGMVLVPLLNHYSDSGNIFSQSLAIMLPVCFVSLLSDAASIPAAVTSAWPFLIGSFIGGFAAIRTKDILSVHWLHRIFGVLLLWSGVTRIW